jgi:hypothetical protein
MMRVFGFMLAGCALGATSLVVARDRPASSADKAETQDAATLARLIYPEALNSAIVTYTIVHRVTPSYRNDPSLRTLEADRPGIIDAIIAAMRPVVEQGRREALPRLWAETGEIYAAGLTPDELRQAVAFHKSPAGRRLALAERNAVANASPRPDRAGHQAGQRTDADPEDVRSRRVFAATPTGRKLSSLRPQIEAIVKAWNNSWTPEADARLGEAMSKAADRFYDLSPEPVRLTPTARPQPRGREPAD